MTTLCFVLISDDATLFRTPMLANINESVFCKHRLNTRICPPGKTANQMLKPELRCNDRFHIIYDDGDNITKLIIDKSGEAYDDYTIYVNDDKSYSAVACLTPSKDPTKEK